MLRRARGGALFSLGFPVLVLAILALTQVSVEPDRPPAEVGTLDLDVTGPDWTSEPIRVDATVIGLTWEGDAPSSAAVRVSDDGTEWGPWTDIHEVDDHGPDPDTGESPPESDASEGVYVGDARWLQFQVDGRDGSLGVDYVDTTGRDRSLVEEVLDFFSRVRFGRVDGATASPTAPSIIPRSAWGGDQCLAQSSHPAPSYVRRVQLLFVHHTIHSASANAYTADDVDDLLYAICSYHVSVQGWNDIAYNAVIDKFGRVWEGRAGGVDQGVRGAHTAGFNSYSTGVAFLGDHRTTVPSPEAQQAFVDFAAWKLDLHHVDPMSIVNVESLGSSLWSEGTQVQLRAISGHRDAASTSCPGDAAESLIDVWRQQVAATGGPKIFGGWPGSDPIGGNMTDGYLATTFDFHLSEEMSWNLSVTAHDGTEVLRTSGAGLSASVPWDGTVDGTRLPYGRYTVHVDATPTSGADIPRPAAFAFTLGEFKPPFSDDEGSVHEPDIATIYEAGITTGCADERFCPAARLQRWQMALFLTRLQTATGLSLPAASDQGFTDIGWLTPDWQMAVNQLAQLGLTRGTGTATFDPRGEVARWQMALFLTRWLEQAGVGLPEVTAPEFSDIAGLPSEYQTAIDQIAALGITQGTASGVFDPAGIVTRAQMASFLARAMATVSPSSDSPNSTP